MYLVDPKLNFWSLVLDSLNGCSLELVHSRRGVFYDGWDESSCTVLSWECIVQSMDGMRALVQCSPGECIVQSMDGMRALVQCSPGECIIQSMDGMRALVQCSPGSVLYSQWMG